jgi:hypothetical protein
MILKLNAILQIIFCFIFSQVFSQENPANKLILPEPVKGYSFIRDSLTYPEILRRAGVEMAFRAILTIDTLGDVTHTSFESMFYRSLSQPDSICISNILPQLNKIQWKPATLNGEPVECSISMPIIFVLMHCDEEIIYESKMTSKFFKNLVMNPIVIKAPRAFVYRN